MRPGERVGEYLYRLSNILRFKQSRMKDLWYGSYGKCADDFNKSEREKLFRSNPAATIQANNQDLEDIRELTKILEKKIYEQVVGTIIRALQAPAG